MLREITFGEFASLCRKRRIDEDYLVERFPGLIERGGMVAGGTRAFFNRVFQTQYAAETIPYQPLIQFYKKMGLYQRGIRAPIVMCRCGCGGEVAPGRKWATRGCCGRGRRREISQRKYSVEAWRKA